MYASYDGPQKGVRLCPAEGGAVPCGGICWHPAAGRSSWRAGYWPAAGGKCGRRVAEQRRLQEISEIAGLFDLETVRAAMYGPEACTAQEMAYRALRKMTAEGRQSDVENPAAIEAQAVADARAWNQLMADTR